MLKILQKSCIKISDCGYIGLYEEYQKLITSGGKKTMIVAYLAKKHFISERRVWYLIKEFEKDCTFDAF